MNCSEAVDRLGDAIDREMPDQARAELKRHLDACPPCRAKYELERMCKGLVSQKLTMVHTPPDVEKSVRILLQDEDAASPNSSPSWIDRFFANKALAPVLATGLALVAVFFFLSRPQQMPDDVALATNAPDIVQQSMDNFSSILTGDLRPSMTACSADSVAMFLQTAGIPFAPKVFHLSDCRSYGGIVSEVNGARLAHVVYALGDTGILYLYETSWKEACKGTSLRLTAEARKALEEGGWYMRTDGEQRNVVLHLTNGTLIAAVSSMPKEQMVDLLAAQ